MKSIVMLLLAASIARAATPAQIRARGKLIVSVKNQGANEVGAHKDPAHFEKRRFELELAHALANQIVGDPQKLELKLMPRSVRLVALIEDRVDLVISMIAITDERRLQVDFSQPYYDNGQALLVRADSPLVRLSGLEDLAGRKLLALRQTANDPASDLLRRAKARGVTFTVERVLSFAEASPLIEAGKADGLLSHAVNIDAWLAPRAAPGLKLKRSPVLTEESFAVAVKKGNAELLALVNQAIDELRGSGALSAMQKRAGLGVPSSN